MSNLDLEVFAKREEEEKKIMEEIFEFEEEIAPVVKKGDIIEFEIKESRVEDEDIIGKYEVIVVEKENEKVELAIRKLEEEYEDIIPFSELSFLLDSKLIKVLLYTINNGLIGTAINRMNRGILHTCLMIKEHYL